MRKLFERTVRTAVTMNRQLGEAIEAADVSVKAEGPLQ